MLIRFNLLDILNDRTLKAIKIYNILDEIYPKRTNVFKQASSELAKTRTELLEQLKNAGVDISLVTSGFETRLLSPFNAVGSSIIYGTNLTSEGQKLNNVLFYFKKMSLTESEGELSDSLITKASKLLKNANNLNPSLF